MLGCLLEKQQTTPEYYPLTPHALVAACNQKSSREPVMELSEADVRAAVERLRADVLVWAVDGARVERFEHNLDRRLQLDAAAKALVTVLLLRGPQTAGELRGRCERMHAFASVEEVEAALARLAGEAEPFVAALAREPGRKEARWTHLASGEPPAGATPRVPVAPAARLAPPEATPHPLAADGAKRPTTGIEERLARLEGRVADLAATLDRLRSSLGDDT